jgi:hypothetical protein
LSDCHLITDEQFFQLFHSMDKLSFNEMIL